MRWLVFTLFLVLSPAHAEEPKPPEGNVGHYSVGEESDAVTDFATPPEEQYVVPDVNTEIEHNIPAPEPEEAATEEKEPEMPANEVESGRWIPHKTTSVQILDKTKARNVVVRAEVGVESKSGSLAFVVKKCFSSSDNYAPDNAGLIEVFEIDQEKNKRKIFYGWMFSSAPGLSAIEHPIYDLMLVNCSD